MFLRMTYCEKTFKSAIRALNNLIINQLVITLSCIINTGYTMKKVVLYSMNKCPHCETAKKYLDF